MSKITFQTRFPTHIVENSQDEIIQFKVKKPKSTTEEFQFLIKLPYVIVLGDWTPAIYQFSGMKYISQLNGIFSDYMKSKCQTDNHNYYFHQALQFYFKTLNESHIEDKKKYVEVNEDEVKYLGENDYVCIITPKLLEKMEKEFGTLKQCHFIEYNADSGLIGFQHDNNYDCEIANDNTGDHISSLTVVDDDLIKRIEARISKNYDFTQEETKKNFFIFANTTQRNNFPLILKDANMIFAIAPRIGE